MPRVIGNKRPMRDIRGGVHGDYQFWDSANANAVAEQYYLSRLSELAMRMFKWKNLPETVDSRFLEYTLFYEGAVVFFQDESLKKSQLAKKGGYLALQVVLGGDLNVYRVPNTRKAYAVNGYQNMLNQDNSVIIWNNMIRMPEFGRMMFYANKLWKIDRAIDVNVSGQRFPVAILCDENQRLTLKNVYKQYDGNEPFIFGSKDLDLNAITTINTGAPFVADKLQQLKNNTWSEAMMCLGIPNSPTEKKERLVAGEAKVSQGGTLASRSSRLEMRKTACEEINKMFGLDIDVEYNQDLDITTEDGDSSEDEEREGFDHE